ncbi:DUF389 domain-containing protein [Glycomyces terrestris]|uniref:DUF389 domain-containing protein n=1 Tax=Glycomyces terrestris TaxID=2493553 RepID=A0A426UUW4_9ACTN|nr:DUF389 domain-containing protein [Glycomyces terrestris]RRR98125.1 DUF389 domain-containing protein [Glycomyces terrestris]
MLHVRVIAPAALSDEVVRIAVEDEAVANVVKLPGVARSPEGDCVHFDVAREGANAVLEQLRDLGLKERGSIAVEEVDLWISDAAEEAVEAAPGHSEDAVVWEELAARTASETRLTWSYLMFLILAVQIAAIGALLDQPILIVGAMVLGPDFGPVAALCFGVLQRDARLAATAVRTLVAGFAAAIAVTLLCAYASRLIGWIEPSMLDDRPLTSFIIHPDRWSFVVAVLAGVAGILSMTARKSAALVGVFISVTTVPAVGNLAVAIPLEHWSEVGASFVQLAVNLAGMILAGIVTLAIQRAVWRRRPLVVDEIDAAV